jgi:cytosine/adenosine deaminase-related metal-dependent hydrolase
MKARRFAEPTSAAGGRRCDVVRARWLLPITADPIENGALAVENGRIVGVGKADAFAGAAVRDLGDHVLLPGFVNAHTHLEMTCYRGRVAPTTLWRWFEQMMDLRTRPGAADEEREAVSIGAAESLAAGVTCVGDISRTGVQVEALRSSPIRKVCFLELISGANAPPNDAASLASLHGAAAGHAEPDRLVVGISPHALYTVTSDDLLGAATLAAERKAPLTIHVLETAEEAQWLAKGGGPLQAFLSRYKLPTATGTIRGRATELLRRAGLMDQQPLLAHVNYIDDPGLRDLARCGAGVVWCPRSHGFFGHGPHRWRDMLAAGVNLCLGTDSLASNSTLSILDEMRFVRRSAPGTGPRAILEMGTLRGARGLRMEQCTGSLEVGKCADFVTIPWDATGPRDPAANVLDGSEVVDETWIGGVPVAQRPGPRE